MAKSQSELLLLGVLPLVNARHHSTWHCEEPKATKQSQYIRRGEERMPGPGKVTDRIYSPSKGENQGEVGQGSLK